MDTFTKFDRLGDALRSANPDGTSISLNYFRYSEGRDGFCVYLHADDRCFSGTGEQPSIALAKAYAEQDEHDRTVRLAAVEAVAELAEAA